MKKFLSIAAMTLLVSISMCAGNFITIGDDVRIHPKYIGGYFQTTAVMQIEGMADSWTINTEFPKGITVKLVAGISPLDGMNINYIDRFGQENVCVAPLQASSEYRTISSEVSTLGYWDYDQDGYWDCYGTVKWQSGNHELFDMLLAIAPDFRDGYLGWSGVITSGADQRGAVLQGVRFSRPCHLWVGYMLGDVTGNDSHNVDDVTALISYVLKGDGLDEFGVAAADVNQDGNVTIADVTMLISMVLRK